MVENSMIKRRRPRRLGATLAAGYGFLALGLGASSALADTDSSTLIMGGTGNPDPGQDYLDQIYDAYIAPNIAPQTATPTGLITPEEGFPLTGLDQMTFDRSIAEGVDILGQAVGAEPAGTETAVFGFSQSATVASNYLDGIVDGAVANPPDPDELRFVLAGDPNNPDGGLFERFDGLYIPGFNESFNGATPDTDYPTDIYTLQYDGFADFPRYPANLLADLNAVAGMFYGHLAEDPDYQALTPEQVASAQTLAVSPDQAGETDYHMVLAETLPLLRPLELPEWLLNLIEPELRVLVDLGYGNIGDGGGGDAEYADVATPASLFETVDPLAVTTALADGVVQGVQADLVLAGLLPESQLPDAYPFVPSLDPGLSINAEQSDTTLVSTLTSAIGDGLRDLDIPDLGADPAEPGGATADAATAGLDLDLTDLLG